MKKKYAGMCLGVVVAAVLLFVLLPGVRIVGPFARLNVDEEFYLYDMETEEIIGTVPVTLKGYFENITGKFYGTVCVGGYELQYPQKWYNAHIGKDEVVFWVHDTEMVYNGQQNWDNFYGDYNYYVRVCRNHGNGIVCCVLTQNEGFGENGGSYSGRYYALQGKSEAEALELYQAYSEEIKEKSTASTDTEK